MTATATLYEIADELVVLIDQLQESGGDVTDEAIAEAFAQLSGDFREKVGRTIQHIRNLEALSDARFREARRLEDSAKGPLGAAERLKAYLKLHMERVGEKKVETALGTARIQNNPPSVKSTLEGDAIPEAFRRTKVTVELNKSEVVAHWKADKPLPAGIVVEQGQHLRIV